MNLKTNDVIRLRNENGMFVIEQVWSDNEVLAVGGRIIQVSDVAEVVDSEVIADMLLDASLE